MERYGEGLWPGGVEIKEDGENLTRGQSADSDIIFVGDDTHVAFTNGHTGYGYEELHIFRLSDQMQPGYEGVAYRALPHETVKNFEEF